MTSAALSPNPLISRFPPELVHRKAAALARRQVLGEAYLGDLNARHAGVDIPRDTGIRIVRDSNLAIVADAVEEARRMLADREGRLVRAKGSLDYFTNGPDYDEHSAAAALAWAPEILAPIIRYFGMLPILQNIFVTRAPATELMTDSSHMLHADSGDDLLQMKVIVNLTDVDEDCGPFHAIPAAPSQRVMEALNYGKGRIMDDAAEAVIGPGRAVALTGPAGTFCYCDTTRCLHFGGRPAAAGKPKRDLLFLRYVLPTSKLYAKAERAGQPARTVSLMPRPDDEIWNAFIGETLV